MLVEKVSLSWTDYQSNIVKKYSALRHEDDLCDVTLASDDQKQVSAHKLVLASCSEYFKNLFKRNKHSNPLVCLQAVTSNDLENVLDYIYNGEVNIHQEQLDTFLDVAQRLGIEGLTSGVRQIVKDYKETKQNQDTKNSAEKNLETQITKDIIDSQYLFETDEGKRVLKSEDNSISNQPSNEEINAKILSQMYRDGNKMWNCKVCPKIDKDKGHMKDHVEIHLEGISFRCNIINCPKSYKTRSSLRSHERLIHDVKLRG